MKSISSKVSGPTCRTTGPDHRTTRAGAALLHTGGPDRPACGSGPTRTGPGGQQASPQGDSTRDVRIPDCEYGYRIEGAAPLPADDDWLIEFEAEQRLLCNGHSDTPF